LEETETMKKLISAFLLGLILSSCATVQEIYRNPVEEAAANKDQYAKITFYNNTNLALYPSSSAIGIEIVIDGKVIPRLRRNRYIDVYVKKGRHDLQLTHWDVFEFTDNYNIEFKNDTYIIEVYCGLISTPYDIKNELPKDFNANYEKIAY
jgi:hypothetical protein